MLLRMNEVYLCLLMFRYLQAHDSLKHGHVSPYDHSGYLKTWSSSRLYKRGIERGHER